MKEYKSPRRLPSGEFTKDDIAYTEAYEIIAKSGLKYFPGYEWISITCDHTLEFASREYYNDGSFQFIHRFELPLSACKSLIWGEIPKRVRRFDMYTIKEDEGR